MSVVDICYDLQEFPSEIALESIGKIKGLLEQIMQEYENVLETCYPEGSSLELSESEDIKESMYEELEEIEEIYADVQDDIYAKEQEKLQQQFVSNNTIYVVDNFSDCVKEKHSHIRKRVYVKINTKIGIIRKEEAVIWYCEECNKNYMLKSTYNELKKEGTLLCLVEDETKAKANTKRDGKFDTYEAESLLTRCGYNVRASAKLTSIQRHNILHAIILSEYSTINRIVSHLQWNIEGHKNIKNHEKAVEKWEEDLAWLTNIYQQKDIKKMGDVGKLVLKYKK